jgi:hypothetical protein
MPASDAAAFLKDARATYVAANRGTLAWMLDRPRQHGAFVDTKMNSITLADYGEADGWRGPRFTYGWIQGRGLEALSTHAAFFAHEESRLAARLDEAGRTLYRAMADLYDRHGGAFFTYDEGLTPVIPGEGGQPVPQELGSDFFTYSDAFVLKGLIAGATRCDLAGRPRWLERLVAVITAIEEGRFIMEERHPLTAETAARQEPEFGPRMILMGAAGLLAWLDLRREAAFGDRFIAHVLDRHWDREDSGLIRDVEGGDRCNVGHAIELAGFAMEYLPADADRGIVAAFAEIAVTSFEKGFLGPGLCLQLSASTGEALSPYFPWWSLPEAIRAASLVYVRTRDPRMLAVWKRAHEAFFNDYWRGDPPVAYQTCDRNGPIDYVPATPDLDPGYHTGLSLLGAIKAIDIITD